MTENLLFLSGVKVFHSLGTIFKSYVLKEYQKNNRTYYQTNTLICGFIWFECEFSHAELVELNEHIEIFSTTVSEFPSLKSINYLCQKIETNNALPLFDIVYLFNNNSGTNISNFYKKIINSAEYQKEDEDNKTFFIYNQLFLNRTELNKMWDNSKTKANSWIFSNGNAMSDFSRFDKIKNYVPNLHLVWKNIPTEYDNCSSLEELISVILDGKNVDFKQELSRYVLDNVLLDFNFGKEMSIFNIPFFEKLSLLFRLDNKNIKSTKDIKRYIEILDKISLDTPSETFLFKDLNHKKNMIDFCSLFEEEPLEVLQKTNIPYHLIEGNISMIKKHYETNPKISIKKEKKLYYFLSHLSKKLSQDLPKELLINPNGEFNNQKISHWNGFFIETVLDSKQLLQIGIRLNNCAGNFELYDDYNKNYVFIVKNENKEFLGTIFQGELDQFKGYKNETPSIELFNQVVDFLKDNNYIQLTNEIDTLYKKCCFHQIFID